MKKYVQLFLMTAALVVSGTELTTCSDFNISTQWKPKSFMKRDFWMILPASFYNPQVNEKERVAYENKKLGVVFLPYDKLSPALRKTMELPAFKETAVILPSMNLSQLSKDKNGTWSYKFDAFLPSGKVSPERPFFLNTMRLTRLLARRASYIRLFYFDKFDHDIKAFDKWVDKHPNYAGALYSGEWGNNALNMHRRRKLLTVLSKKDHQILTEKFSPNSEFKSGAEYINGRLKPYFDRTEEIFPYHSKMIIEGVDNIAHLAAEWGKGTVGTLAMESSRHNVRWQLQMMHTRGAARQYGLRWAWYVASFYTGKTSAKKRLIDSECTAWRINSRTGPENGLSMSIRKRVFFLSYLSGASFMQREDAVRNFFDFSKIGKDRWKPAPEGQMYINFFNFTKKNPNRGTPYAPVALLVGRNRGTWRNIGRTFRYLPNIKPKHSDFMFNAFIASILPFEKYRPGLENSLRNGKYGDSFDMLTPDSNDDDGFVSILNSYKAAVLIGEYEETPARIKIMSNYVRNGGTLIVCARQLRNWNPEVTGVKITNKTELSGEYLLDIVELSKGTEILLKDKDGHPLITRKTFGKGAVIVGTPRWFAPYFDDKSKSGQAPSRAFTYSYAEWILKHLVDETLPVKVTGNIQYGLNKTDDGWWIYLINNNGITKFTDAFETFDMSKTSKITVDLRNISAYRVKELLSGQPLSVKDGRFTIAIPPGGIAVCKIITGKNNPSKPKNL